MTLADLVLSVPFDRLAQNRFGCLRVLLARVEHDQCCHLQRAMRQKGMCISVQGIIVCNCIDSLCSIQKIVLPIVLTVSVCPRLCVSTCVHVCVCAHVSVCPCVCVCECARSCRFAAAIYTPYRQFGVEPNYSHNDLCFFDIFPGVYGRSTFQKDFT